MMDVGYFVVNFDLEGTIEGAGIFGSASSS
jgi:hypothetical protein